MRFEIIHSIIEKSSIFSDLYMFLHFEKRMIISDICKWCLFKAERLFEVGVYYFLYVG